MTTRPEASAHVYEVICFADTDLVTTSFAVTALVELARAGQIRLRWRLRDLELRGVRSPFTVWCHVRELPRGAWRRVCFDLHDADTHLDLACLRAGDRYFKMNLSERSREAAPRADREKFEPFGPATACRPTADARLGLRWCGACLGHAIHQASMAWKEPRLRERAVHLARQATRIRRYRQRPDWKSLEPAGEASAEGGAIFFNPTCWQETTPAIREMNQFRAEVIRRLRTALGARFQGGFRRSPLAESQYAEALEERHYPTAEYVALLRASPLAIYTNGINGCFSWRLYENFAAGKCMVSEPIPNDPGFPLHQQTGLIVCGTPERLVEEVTRLLEAPAERAAMAAAAWQTYLDWLQPQTRMRRLIEHAVQLPAPAAAARRLDPPRTSPCAS